MHYSAPPASGISTKGRLQIASRASRITHHIRAKVVSKSPLEPLEILPSTWLKECTTQLDLDDDLDDAFDDDERKTSKKNNFVSNDRSGHGDQNAYWIIKNGAILEG